MAKSELIYLCEQHGIHRLYYFSFIQEIGNIGEDIVRSYVNPSLI